MLFNIGNILNAAKIYILIQITKKMVAKNMKKIKKSNTLLHAAKTFSLYLPVPQRNGTETKG